MRILYLHRTASKDGQDVHITEMVAALRRQGHTVKVVAPPQAEAARFGDGGGWVARLKRRLPRPLYEILELAYSVPAYVRLRRAWRDFRPDLLYERYNLFFLAGLWLKRRTGIRYLVEVNAPLAAERAAHDGLALPALARWSERAVWRAADAVLPVTAVLATALRQAGVSAESIEVIPNGVDRTRFPASVDGADFRRAQGLEGRLVLGFTGFVRPWHGLPRVVEAMAAWGAEVEAVLVVAGDGPGLAELEAQARRAGLGERVRCLGVVGRDRMAECIAAFDIALQPRVVEYASPLKLFEYMALGRAIIAPDQANIREVLRDGDSALLFRPGDSAHFQGQLRRLAGDPHLRRRLGCAASDAIDRRSLTWDANARRVVARAEGGGAGF